MCGSTVLPGKGNLSRSGRIRLRGIRESPGLYTPWISEKAAIRSERSFVSRQIPAISLTISSPSPMTTRSRNSMTGAGFAQNVPPAMTMGSPPVRCAALRGMPPSFSMPSREVYESS
ncbi:MAG: hypothetical protein BWX71_02839 [Deltaproteobacteria bacterium ADurb.Bin072]|nr:MAG: hypothetical protein BWX71_02839 [Deltaproteobacteria bacterium ADurb.Bin072]